MIAFFNFNKIQEYSQGDQFYGVSLIWLITFVVVGICFFLLGWLISALTRVKDDGVLSESHKLKKTLLSELNVAKKFNSDYQVRARSEKQKNNSQQVKISD